MENLLTVAEVAVILRISESGLRSLVRQGKIPGKKLGPRSLRFDPEVIDRWRKQFFEIPEEDQDVTEEKGKPILDFSDKGERENLGKVDRRDRPEKGHGQSVRTGKPGTDAEKLARRLLDAFSGNPEGG